MKNTILRLTSFAALLGAAAAAHAQAYPQVPPQPTADVPMPAGQPYAPYGPPQTPGAYGPMPNGPAPAGAPYNPGPSGYGAPGTSSLPPYSAPPPYSPAPATRAAYDSPAGPAYQPAPSGPSYSPAPAPYTASPYGAPPTPSPAGPPAYTPAPGGPTPYAPVPNAPPTYTPAPYEPLPGGPPSYTPAPVEHLPRLELEGPRWLFAADAMFLERSIGSSIGLGYTVYNPGSGSPPAVPTDTLYSDDEPMGLEPGLRLQLGRRVSDDVAIDAIYWGLNQWSAGRQIYGDPFGDTVLAFSPYTQTDAIIGGFNNYLGYTYNSQANNIEINERVMLGQHDPYHSLAWLWGVRYFQMSDNFTLSGDDLDTGDYENINWKTHNNLLGLQAGLQWTRGWDRFQLVTEGKAGIYANMYDQKGNNLDSSGVVYGQPAGFVPYNVSHDGTDVSALFELSLIGRYRLNDWLWLRLGYQAYLMTGLALAPRQLNGYSHGGTVAFDGPSIGLEATW